MPDGRLYEDALEDVFAFAFLTDAEKEHYKQMSRQQLLISNCVLEAYRKSPQWINSYCATSKLLTPSEIAIKLATTLCTTNQTKKHEILLSDEDKQVLQAQPQASLIDT